MKKVLIIDDEKLIRLGIKSIITRNYGDKYDVLLCSNGLEGFEILKSNHIHFVITDIRMPDCDGITLLKKLSIENINVPVIILSGYDDFSYAVEALRYGAKDYLLKPINKEELYSTIEKIENNYDKVVSYSNGIETTGIREDISARFNVLLLNENLSVEDLDEKLSVLCPFLNKDNYYIGIIFNKEFSCRDKEEITRNYEDLLKNIFYENISFNAFLDNYNNLTVIFSNDGVIEKLKDYLFKNKKSGYFAGISERLVSYENFKKGYINALIALKGKLFYGESANCYCYEALRKNKKVNISREDIYKLSNLIGTKRNKEIMSLIDSLFNEEYVLKEGIEYLEAVTNELIEYINQYVVKHLNNVGEINKKMDILKNVLNFNKYKEFYYVLKDLIIYLDEYLFQIKNTYSDKKFIEKAVVYINENYNKDLSLAVVSNVVSLNYSYFSQVFKEHTGENFISYLKKVRIEKAKQLLSNKELKIYEVAKQVGIDDSRQFTKTFKCLTGITPLEYREKQLLK